jgi:hypothetical protein
VPVGSELLQATLTDEVKTAHAILPWRVACNPTLGNLAMIRNSNLEDSHIVHLQAFLQTAAYGYLQVHSYMALIWIHHYPIHHVILN